MRRPLCIFCCAFLAGIYFAALCRGEGFWGYLAAGAAALQAGGLLLVRLSAGGGSPGSAVKEQDGIATKERAETWRRQKLLRLLAWAVLLFLAGGLRFWTADQRETVLTALVQESNAVTEGQFGKSAEVQLVGRVRSLQRQGENCRILLQATSVRTQGEAEDAASCREPVLLWCKGLPENAELLGGKEVSLWANLELPAGKRNPGSFDYSSHLKGNGVRIIGSTEAAFIKETGKCWPLLGLPDRLRQRFSAWLEGHTDAETAALLVGMVLGDKSLLEEDLRQAFQDSGLSHLLAVSGLHVTLLSLWVSKLSRAPKGRPATLLGLGVLGFYGALCDFSPSVVRGITMIAFRKLGELHRKRYDFLTGALAAAALTAALNPYRALQAGFLLSYGAVLSLAVLLPPLQAWVEARKRVRQDLGMRILLGVLSAAGASLVIFLGMAPVTALFFHQVAPVSLLLNLPAMALAGVIMPLGFLLFLYCTAGCPVMETAARLLLIAEELLLKALTALGRAGSGRPLVLEGPGIGFLMLWYGGLVLLFSEWGRMARKQPRKWRAALALLLVLALLLPGVGTEGLGDAGLIFVDVGQGDCLHIRTPGGKNFLIDGGGSANSDVGKELLKPYLLANGITRLSGVLVTHLHDDHYKGLVTLCRELPVGSLVLYEGNRSREAAVLQETGLGAEKLTYVSAGDRILLEEGIWLEILWPNAPDGGATSPKSAAAVSLAGTAEANTESAVPADENASSLVVKVHYLGVTVLMTADLGFAGETALLQQGCDLAADILKVGHHGSAYSTGDAFLAAVAPKAALIQVGAGNSYGHPAPSVLEKLQDSGIMVYRNDLSGAVLVTVTQKGFRIRTVR